ncbi:MULTISPECIES: beta-ketoacyl-ACP synthase III [Corallincola]|uniref:Beta-ketoacyl-[acyl-carrier-protein] synthase III n=2 Tax=Corallincola TaxID=1775176 RepID=A0ABY1WVU7_9GAMM|nr:MULTISPECIES: beta-ketoacyl-ACP synthase III [Corallincola]TAA48743.1 ketoacyl-ACP synthase III [Corallincola spongiicola]TCI02539.1 ketoacyl-ACP synthase III [Corallincola luteus]
MYSKISGTGSHLPELVRTNADLEEMVDTTHQWIVERTGIIERRIAGPDETVATMGAEAAKNALEAAGLTADQLDMIICATTSAEHAFPSAACEIQRILNAPPMPAFDVAAACAGFSYVLSVADQFIRTGQAKNILVIGADVLSRMADPEDRGTIILFGDGAGAAVLTASEEPGILSTHINADGRYGDLLKIRNMRPGQEDHDWLFMKGNEVFKVAVTKLSEVVEQTLKANNLDKQELDWLVPHQANLRIIQATAKKLKMSMDQVVVNLHNTGNTSAASVPVALDEAIRDGRIKRGELLLLEAFGGGFAWGAALVRY